MVTMIIGFFMRKNNRYPKGISLRIFLKNIFMEKGKANDFTLQFFIFFKKIVSKLS